MAKQSKKALEEVKKCQEDFDHFCQYLKITNKKGKLVPFKPNTAQKQFYKQLNSNPWIYTLKARQLGMSTAIAARLFWRVLFTPNFKCAVVAHTHPAVKNIFEIYRRFYSNLPSFLQFKYDASSTNELKFFHGGTLKVSSASSSHFRGSTFHAIHVSELCFYTNLKESIAAIFQTATDNAEIIIETTANGLNEGYQLWMEDSGFNKFFIPWFKDRNYKTKLPLPNKTGWESDYQSEYNLSERQIAWVRQTIDTKCAGDLNIFHQEYPASAALAFITTGTKFFRHTYPEALLISQEGLIEYNPPREYRSYIIGVDTAGGSPDGDYSAACVIDVTNHLAMEVVATYYAHKPISVFAQDILDLSNRYNALVVIESNNHGVAVIEKFQMANYPHLFRRVTYDKAGDRYIEKLGFNTSAQTRPLMLSRIQENINKMSLAPVCQRLKYEINSFVYNNNGRPEAATGQHDDLVFAASLALMGLDQADYYIAEKTLGKRPKTLEEKLRFELNTGKLYSDQQEWNDDEWESASVSSLGEQMK